MLSEEMYIKWSEKQTNEFGSLSIRRSIRTEIDRGEQTQSREYVVFGCIESIAKTWNECNLFMLSFAVTLSTIVL